MLTAFFVFAGLIFYGLLVFLILSLFGLSGASE